MHMTPPEDETVRRLVEILIVLMVSATVAAAVAHIPGQEQVPLAARG